MHAIKREITVDANHEIRLTIPEAPVGCEAEVIVLFKQIPETAEPENFTDFQGKFPRYNSMDEVVAHIRELREDRE